MFETLIFTYEKFIFRVASDRLYHAAGVWMKDEDGMIRIGVSDFLQQRSGDVAFAEVKCEGSELAVGEEVATIETIKVNVDITSPVSGEIIAVNQDLEAAPEIINQDPYGAGWLVLIRPGNWDSERLNLLNAQQYLEIVKEQAKSEAGG